MWKVLHNLYLGTREDSEHIAMLTSTGVTHIVNCAVELPCLLKDIHYQRLDLKDPDTGLRDKLKGAFAFIDEGRKAGVVLVHCNGAISRSPALVLAYLCHCGFTLEASTEIVRRVLQTRPNEIFLRQICDYFSLDRTRDEIVATINQLAREVV